MDRSRRRVLQDMSVPQPLASWRSPISWEAIVETSQREARETRPRCDPGHQDLATTMSWFASLVCSAESPNHVPSRWFFLGQWKDAVIGSSCIQRRSVVFKTPVAASNQQSRPSTLKVMSCSRGWRVTTVGLSDLDQLHVRSIICSGEDLFFKIAWSARVGIMMVR